MLEVVGVRVVKGRLSRQATLDAETYAETHHRIVSDDATADAAADGRWVDPDAFSNEPRGLVPAVGV